MQTNVLREQNGGAAETQIVSRYCKRGLDEDNTDVKKSYFSPKAIKIHHYNGKGSDELNTSGSSNSDYDDYDGSSYTDDDADNNYNDGGESITDDTGDDENTTDDGGDHVNSVHEDVFNDIWTRNFIEPSRQKVRDVVCKRLGGVEPPDWAEIDAGMVNEMRHASMDSYAEFLIASRYLRNSATQRDLLTTPITLERNTVSHRMSPYGKPSMVEKSCSRNCGKTHRHYLRTYMMNVPFMR